MRKHQQKQILEVIETLYEAQVSELYADCQEGALGVGEYIEEIVGEGTATVSLLEEYCELIYKASNGEATQKELKNKLKQVEKSIVTELKPNRIEMIFLSYKAAMSDSIESIYMAAKEDPNCDAYWIPIPYYDKNPDGSFGDKHYEGAEYYKENIVCTDYREYDIQVRYPDVIISFSPYDNLGKMTSVDPDYYFENLRNQTDMLVYVPYYVTTFEAAKPPFTQCPGVLYSHKVIVQSEEIRECFIRDYNELIKLGYSEEIYGKAEDKFVALGSPKFDAVINAKREDYKLPTEWQNLIQNPGGSKKKVIFYNTSITASLNNPGQYLKKVKYVLNTFKQHNDVLLWWRPHPLARTAYSGIYPELEKEYDDIVAEYRSAGWGIYDDTPDLHRAIVWSDAYYGDYSSVVLLYEVTGKPVLLQNAEKIEDDNDELSNVIRFTDLYDDGENYWVSALDCNALFKIDKATLKAEYKGSFPVQLKHTTLLRKFLYSSVCEIDNKLYFAPCNATEIGVYDLITGIFSSIPISMDYNINSSIFKFMGIYKTEEGFFLIPAYYQAIVFYNVNKDELSYYNDCYELLNEMCLRKGEKFAPISLGTAVFNMYKNKLCFPCYNVSAIIKLDINSGKVMVSERQGDESNRFSSVIEVNDKCWLIKINGDIEIVASLDSEYYSEVIKLPDDDSIKNTNRFAPPILYDDFIWLLPSRGQNAYKINSKTKEITHLEGLECDKLINEYGYISYSFLKVENNHIITLSIKEGLFKKINKKGDIIQSTHIRITDDDCKLSKRKMKAEALASTLFEYLFFNLTDLIESVSEIEYKKMIKCESNSGSNIYEYTKQDIFKGR
ncbi:MAG: hypothetical protein LBC71_02465 [Oscillospiraceae bacterium]|jgi:hypothetical protein|nr:hypothetical protein [Oscillospiraceae bacterium]